MTELLELCQVGRSPKRSLKKNEKNYVLPICSAYIWFHDFLVTLNILCSITIPKQPTSLVIQEGL